MTVQDTASHNTNETCQVHTGKTEACMNGKNPNDVSIEVCSVICDRCSVAIVGDRVFLLLAS